MEKYRTTLPAGYREVDVIDIKNDKRVRVWGDILSVLLMVATAGVGCFAVPLAELIHFDYTDMAALLSVLLRLLAAGLGGTAVVVLACLLAAAAMRWCGAEKTNFGITKGLVCTVGCDGYFSRGAYMRYTLTAPAILFAVILLAALVVWLIFGDQIKEAITGEKPPITDVDKPDDTIDKPDDTPVTPTISLNRTVLVLNVGEKDELKVNGTEDAAAWSSSAPTVASVNSAGEVTALTKGNAVITAEVNGESVTCTVTVKDESDAPDNGTDTPDNNSTTTKPNNSNKPSTGSVDVSKLTLESEYGTTIKPNDGTFDISLPVGLSCSFTVKGTDMTAAWSSANSSIATVSADGAVKTVSRGETTLTIKIGSTEVKCLLRVTK